MSTTENYDKYFLSYTGIKLPLQLVSPLEEAETQNRNTYFGACFDEQGNLVLVHKVVYGEIELEHRYGYYSDGQLKWADILDDEDEIQHLEFDTAGVRVQ